MATFAPMNIEKKRESSGLYTPHRYSQQSFRLSYDDRVYISYKGRGKSTNEALNICIRLLREMESEGLAEIRGYLEPGEWKYIANVLKGSEEPIASKNELTRRVMDIKMFEVLASYYGVEPAKLSDKIQGLNSCHVLAISQRCHEYWLFGEPQGVTIDEWARY